MSDPQNRQVGEIVLQHRDLKQRIASHSQEVERIIPAIHTLAKALPEEPMGRIGAIATHIQHHYKPVDWGKFTSLIDEIVKLQAKREQLERTLKTEWNINL